MVRQLTTPPVAQDSSLTASQFCHKLKQAAKTAFRPTEYPPRAPWSTQDTLTKLQQAKTATAAGDHDAKQSRNQAKQSGKPAKIESAGCTISCWRTLAQNTPQCGKPCATRRKTFKGASNIWWQMVNQYHGPKRRTPSGITFNTSSGITVPLRST